jgi:hypothetical protein
MRISLPGSVNDDGVVATLSRFKKTYAEVNGIRLHYVAGAAS